MNHGNYTAWRKSRYSNSSGNCVEVTFAGWRKSSYSTGSGNCVEVAFADWRQVNHSSGDCVEVAAAEASVAVRDSKQHGHGPILEFTCAEWKAFLQAAKDGRLGL